MEDVFGRRSLDVRDPRSPIWGHTGFTADGHEEIMTADYAQKPPADVMIDFACYQVGRPNQALVSCI